MSFDTVYAALCEKYVMSEGKRNRTRKNIWRGYKKTRARKASKDTDLFSQYRNQRVALKQLNPYNTKRFSD